MLNLHQKIMIRQRGALTLPKRFRKLFIENDGLMDIYLSEINEIQLHKFNYTKNEFQEVQLIGSRKMTSQGILYLPSKIVALLELQPKDVLEVFQKNEIIIIRRLSTDTCIVTGEVSPDNYKLLNGRLVLSEEGADLLFKELIEVVKDSKIH